MNLFTKLEKEGGIEHHQASNLNPMLFWNVLREREKQKKKMS